MRSLRSGQEGVQSEKLLEQSPHQPQVTKTRQGKPRSDPETVDPGAPETFKNRGNWVSFGLIFFSPFSNPTLVGEDSLSSFIFVFLFY